MRQKRSFSIFLLLFLPVLSFQANANKGLYELDAPDSEWEKFYSDDHTRELLLLKADSLTFISIDFIKMPGDKFSELKYTNLLADSVIGKSGGKVRGEIHQRNANRYNNMYYRDYTDRLGFPSRKAVVFTPGAVYILDGVSKNHFDQVTQTIDSFNDHPTLLQRNSILWFNLEWWGVTILFLLIFLVPTFGWFTGDNYRKWKRSGYSDINKKKWLWFDIIGVIIALTAVIFIVSPDLELILTYFVILIILFLIFCLFSQSKFINGFIKGFMGD